ncbi:hypothetical protein [Sphingomonas sp.]|uniref:hypothetical protein n=1 Tax=Sphingomonas sp. TaxID=28214 RepID=UPI002CAA1144|nr:hypothetical protein [Sphingomonas sp.]HWK34828.1 hypothetical protein [Sphingomonas sp.]
MDAHFTIDVDPERDLVRIAMDGFFNLADIDRFLEARAEAHKALTCAPNAHLTINDLRGMKIQSKDSVARFGALLAGPEYRSRRLAFVVGPTLARGQLARLITHRTARCFDTPAIAEAWLFDESGQVSDAA